MTATYTPGEWSAVVDGETIALLDPAVSPDSVRAVWDAVVGGGGVAGVIRTLATASGGDFAAIPSFAVAAPQRGGLALAVRGRGRVRVRTAGGEVDASGLDVTTWSERWVADPLAVEVVAPTGAVAPDLPLRSGVAAAARVAVTLADDAAPLSAVPAPAAGRADAPAVGEETHAEPDVPVHVAPVEVPDTPREVGAGSAARFPEPGLPPDAVDREQALDGPAARVGHAQPADGPSGRLDETRVEAPDDGGYDHLWGRTVLRSVEEAARRGDEEDRQDSAGPMSGPVGEPATADRPGIAEVYSDDHDGQTIFRPRRPAAEAASAPPEVAASSAAGPTVLARVCAQGHPNPPQGAQCRVCGQPLGGDAVRVPRPVLGRARLSSGDVLLLDTPAILGRSPKTGRVAGSDVPRPISVPSPTREVSGTHLAIQLEEWHVLVVDVGSSNGTVLRRPGQPPQRLHPREPALVFSGDVVDLGDGVTLAFEDLP